MQRFIYQLASSWQKKIHPRLISFISFFGVIWLGICLFAIYVLAKLSEDVWEKEAFAFDKTILLHIHQFANPALDTIMISITRLGDPRTVVPVTLAIFGFLLWRQYRLEARFFALNAIGGAILSYGLKLAFSKPRPKLWPQLISEKTFSYPSGHALGSMVLYGFLAYLLASLYSRYSSVFYSIFTVLIIAIGFSRLYLGVHWPTDVIAGYGVGFLWIVVCITLLRRQKMKVADAD